MRSVMSHQFSKYPEVKVARSSFDRSHGHKTTFDAGKLIPIFVDEALPGDTFAMKMTALVRMTTPIYPIMDNIMLDVHFFAVPNRLIWSHWQAFCGEQANPGDSTDYTLPRMEAASTCAEGTVADYLGIPIGATMTLVSALPFRALNLIFNEWYRDQNLVSAVEVPTDDGPDDYTVNYNDGALLYRMKRHDYFTSCLPWPQKSESAPIPLGLTAPVKGLGKETQSFAAGPAAAYETGESASVSYANYRSIDGGSADQRLYVEEDPDNSGFPGIYADLSSAAGTINALREAFQVQKLFERDARGGTRYVEVIRAHFGVTSPDARLQRPEYLGGGSFPINIHPIAQTSATDATVTPQGNLAAMAVGSGIAGFRKSFTEHCTLIGIMSARADLTYQQGIDRMFLRSTRYDFYWPVFANLGEQAVMSREIYHSASVDTVFGYQERYAEYRYKPSRISAAFRSSAAAPLDAWHLSQEFSSEPSLDVTFIRETPPMARVLAVDPAPDFIADMYFQLRCARPMPVYSIPGLVDHF